MQKGDLFQWATSEHWQWLHHITCFLFLRLPRWHNKGPSRQVAIYNIICTVFPSLAQGIPEDQALVIHQQMPEMPQWSNSARYSCVAQGEKDGFEGILTDVKAKCFCWLTSPNFTRARGAKCCYRQLIFSWFFQLSNEFVSVLTHCQKFCWVL